MTKYQNVWCRVVGCFAAGVVGTARCRVARCLAAGVIALLSAACTDDSPAAEPQEMGDDLVALTLDVVESGWADDSFSVTTRAGETIDGLKATTGGLPTGYGYGFCLHGANLLGSATVRRQVTWNATTGQWNSGQLIYWRRTSADDYFRVYAYAPYKTTDYTYTEVSEGDIDDVQKGGITFTADNADGTNIDLLYAGAKVNRTDGRATLVFNHAMAMISFGTITNNTGGDLSLSTISVKGNIHTVGQLNLTSGAWTPTTTVNDKTYTRSGFDFDPDVAGNQPLLTNGSIKPLNIAPLVLIPGPTVTIELDFGGSNQFSFTTTLERGKNKTYNITVEKNFEVVIE